MAIRLRILIGRSRCDAAGGSRVRGEEFGGEREVDEPGPGDLRGLADVGEVEVVDDRRRDVPRLRLQLLGQRQGHIGLEVRELAAADDRVAVCEVLTEGGGEGGGETVREHRSQRWHEAILLPRASCLGIGSGLGPPARRACNVGHVTYLRYPHVHADLITFTADDDVWLVGSAGGRAWRLTSDRCARPITADLPGRRARRVRVLRARVSPSSWSPRWPPVPCAGSPGWVRRP
jgi:hypothetical protein